jgi:uncharacterized protein
MNNITSHPCVRHGRLLALGLLVGLLPGLAWATSYAEHTPGFQSTVEGSRAYQAGHYPGALSRFMAGAYWADKLAQFNVGVMHYHGQGVERDPARAAAWLKLSAERGYPEMADMAELVSDELNEVQRARATRILEEELLPIYGDDVAIERTAKRMQRERRRATGSRTGFIGSLVVIDRSGRNRGGDEFFRAQAWDFRQIVELETRIFRALAEGSVTLGDLEIIEDDGEL